MFSMGFWPISCLPFIIGIVGLQITDLRVPYSVQNGTAYAILDCEYALLPEDLNLDSGLVVKWFFNNSPSPVYQWIPGNRPQDLGVLKGRLDLDYRASDQPAAMYRALYIIRPTTELSGDYKCLVSTFREEDFMTKKMVIFSPEKHMVLSIVRPDADRINISCLAIGVYPEPRMALYKDPDRKSKILIQDTSVDKISKNGAYDIKATAVIQDTELQAPTIFGCELFILEAKYYTKKTSVFYPGIMGLVSESRSGVDTLKFGKCGLVFTTLRLIYLLLPHSS